MFADDVNQQFDRITTWMISTGMISVLEEVQIEAGSD
jgi:hypothetical protein